MKGLQLTGSIARLNEKRNNFHSEAMKNFHTFIVSGKSFRLVDVEIFDLFTFRYRVHLKAAGRDRSLCTAIRAAKAGNGRNAELKYWFCVQEI